MKRTRAAPRRVCRLSGFTLVELLVVMAVVAVLAAILFPVLARARENARKAACQSNLRQIAQAMLLYAQDYDERIVDYAIFPPQGPVRWPALVAPYVKGAGVFVCPSDPAFAPSGTPPGNSEYLGYGMGCHIVAMPLAQVRNPAATVMAAETRVYLVKAAACDPRTGRADPAYRGQTWGSEPDTTRPVLYRHLEMAGFAFADGHVKMMPKTQAEQTASEEDGVPLSGVDARSATNVFVLWNNAGR